MRFEISSDMRVYLSLCFILLFCGTAFSQQADAGQDRVNCNGKGVKIGGVGDPSWCYSWKPEAGLDDPNILNPIANPTVKTTYTLTVTGPDFSFKSTDDVVVDVLELTDVEYKQSNETIYGKEGSGSVCVGSSYEFKVNTVPAGGSPALCWDLQDLDFFNEEIAKGTGSSFNRVFSTDLEKGTTQARFFCDADDDNTFDSDEANVTLEFEVKDKTTHMVTVSAASTVGTPAAAAILNAGTILLDTRQDAIDYRCCATLSLSGAVGTYTVGPTRPDMIASSTDRNNLINNVSATIRVVNTITWCGGPAPPGFVIAGCATVGTENTTIVGNGYGATVWTHELGHTFGLNHRDSNAANLMHSTAGAGTILNQNESDAFE